MMEFWWCIAAEICNSTDLGSHYTHESCIRKLSATNCICELKNKNIYLSCWLFAIFLFSADLRLFEIFLFCNLSWPIDYHLAFLFFLSFFRLFKMALKWLAFLYSRFPIGYRQDDKPFSSLKGKRSWNNMPAERFPSIFRRKLLILQKYFLVFHALFYTANETENGIPFMILHDLCLLIFFFFLNYYQLLN